MAPSVVRSLALAVIFFAWVGLVAIGVSGALAGAMQVAFGPEFLAGDVPGVTYTPQRCTDLEEYAPQGSSCAHAAALHHSDETVTYRLAAGALGIVVFVAWWLIRRRASPAGRLPAGLVAGAGVGMFGIVGLALLAQGLELLTLGPDTGAGADLSAAIISLVVAALFGASLYRALVVIDRRKGSAEAL